MSANYNPDLNRTPIQCKWCGRWWITRVGTDGVRCIGCRPHLALSFAKDAP